MTNKNNQESTVEKKTSDEKKESEEKTMQSKSDIALDKLRKSIDVDYIEMPWTNNRRKVEDAMADIKDMMATILKPILDEVNDDKNRSFMKVLRSKVDTYENNEPKEIFEYYTQAKKG